MENTFKFDSTGAAAALVIVFPPGINGLFNAQVHGLVQEVQDQLENVYVTYALSSGSSPDLRAAMSAARFVGCDSAVVIPAGSAAVGESAERGTNGDWLLTTSQIGADLTASAVIDAYFAAVSEAGKAA
jgi:hypothetical protein